MKRKLISFILIIFFHLSSSGNSHLEATFSDTINDGPYIFKLNETLSIKWIENSILREDYVTTDNFNEVKNKFNLLFNYKDLTSDNLPESNYAQCYNMIDSIAVITDIHGEFNIYINLLKGNGIIDQNLNWSFGNGHLVVLGDTFDRGDMVTEVFWHLFGLEKQAAKAGGMVHVLLGNHDFMELNSDSRYLNDKYKKVEEISGSKYLDLYSENSVLGRWIRSKPVVITINDIIFVHGGISIEMVQRNLKISQINQIFSEEIIGKDDQLLNEQDELDYLKGNSGPLWYRGYLTDSTFCESRIDSILDFYKKEHIVVGHTTFKDIKSLFNNKILGIDAGIMMGQPGQMLLYKNGIFYKVFITGNRIKL